MLDDFPQRDGSDPKVVVAVVFLAAAVFFLIYFVALATSR
jgi:hypothetical protein